MWHTFGDRYVRVERAAVVEHVAWVGFVYDCCGELCRLMRSLFHR